MANPRGTVNFNEIGYHATTFLRQASSTGAIDYLPSPTVPYPASTSTQLGYAASIVTAKTARAGQAGDVLLGKIVEVSQDCVAIQDKGYAYFSYVAGGTAPVVGQGVICNGSGGVKVVASGSEYAGAHTICVDLDATNLIATILIR